MSEIENRKQIYYCLDANFQQRINLKQTKKNLTKNMRIKKQIAIEFTLIIKIYQDNNKKTH